MTNSEVAEILRTICELLELREENPFKVRAYMTASRAIEGLSEDVGKLVWEGRCEEVFGIGKSIKEKITELVTADRMDFFEDLKKTIPLTPQRSTAKYWSSTPIRSDWTWIGRPAGGPRSGASSSPSTRTRIRRWRSKTSSTGLPRRGKAGWKRGTS